MTRWTRLAEAFLARLPAAARRPARRVIFLPADIADAVFRRTDPLLPPRGMRAVGRGEFRDVGRTFLRLFREWGGLRPTDRVFDVGCGVGRMAVPLTEFLDERGAYLGFDVVRSDVAWCRRAIASRFPRFEFFHADVANAEYNPRGRIAASDFVFPARDGSVDFAIATSVFTHLLPDAAGRYLRETARVLAPGGRCFLTLFLLDDAARAAMAAYRTSYRFESAIGGAFVQDPAMPEAAVAYDETEFRRMLDSSGLRLSRFHRGAWAGGEPASYQDVVICGRSSAS